MKLHHVFATLAITSMTSQAALTAYKDYDAAADTTGVSSGAYVWGMEINPINNVANVDVDGNGQFDFHALGTTVIDTSDGHAGHADGTLFRWDYTGSPPRQAGYEDAVGPGDYTFEVAVNLLGTGTEGSRGVFGLALEIGASPSSGQIQLEIGEDSLYWGSGASDQTGMNPTIATASNLGWHTWRVAYDQSENILYLFKDGVLIDAGADGFDPTGFTGAPGNTYIGDYSGDLSGDWDLDYIAFDTTGAFAPVPEPAMLSLLPLASLALLRRKRQ